MFGIVSRILDVSCDIFGVYRSEYREYARDISIPISCDISHDIDTILHVNLHPTRSRLSQEMTYVFVRVEINVWNKNISSIWTDRRKRLAACVLRILLVGCMNAHQFDARGRHGRQLNSEHIFLLAIKTKASTVLGKGEECVPCDLGCQLRKGGSLTKSCAENTRGWDRKKRKHEWMYLMHVWCVYWSVGCCTSH